MPRKYELIANHADGANPAHVIHGAYAFPGVLKPIPVDKTDVLLDRTVYQGKLRPHARPNPEALKMTVAGALIIPDGTKITVSSQRKNGHQDPTVVLIAEVTGGVLRVLCREKSVAKKKDDRKANTSRLRRSTRNRGTGQEVTFYVWTRDQYRFTIKKQ